MKEKLYAVFVLFTLIVLSPLIMFPFVTGNESITESFQMWREDLKMSLKILGVAK